MTRGIAERLPELIDGRIEAMFEVTGSGSGPKAVTKIFTGHQVARPIHQRAENLARLGGEFYFVTVFTQFPRTQYRIQKAQRRVSELVMVWDASHLPGGGDDITGDPGTEPLFFQCFSR